MSLAKQLVFVAAKRTPFGAFGKSLSKLTATDLAVHASQAAINQSGLSVNEIDHVFFGNVVQSSSDAAYLARHVGLRVGLPEAVPALTVNRLCGSGFEAIVQGAHAILNDGARACLVGGSESMSQVPYVVRKARWGSKMGSIEFEDFLTSSLTDTYANMPMASTAELLARDHQLTRAQCDAYALLSSQRAAAARSKNLFDEEIVPISGPPPLSWDEHLRLDASLEGLGKLKPVFEKEGVVTAGNASGVVDGACALVLAESSFAKARGLKILGTLEAWAAVGCDPRRMGLGPVAATKRVLERWSTLTGKKKSLRDFRRIEVNEAFAAQYLAVEKILELNRDVTNVNGGAIALGHPLAASGARLVAHLLYDLPRAGGGAGLASACIGGGQGMSLVVGSL